MAKRKETSILLVRCWTRTKKLPSLRAEVKASLSPIFTLPRIWLSELCRSTPRRYSHSEVAIATQGFTDEAKCGRGGFGPVYRGYLGDQDRHVAIKVLSQGSSIQGAKEFEAEVNIMTSLRHRNIVQLLGWCDAQDHRDLLLVYEFVPNGSLDKHLYDPQRILTWSNRYKVALGVGSAILYLHTECGQCVVHGDIKPANIMLDTSCNAKLGDFGQARFIDHDADPRTTHVVAGTLGYIDPEFVNNRRPSAESDVYSFGVVLLEMACGRRPTTSTQQSNRTPALVNWVRDMYRRNSILGAADRRLDGEFDERQMVHASGAEPATDHRASHGCAATGRCRIACPPRSGYAIYC
ncbi:hypothetical protein QOZ80_6BG0486290 [Eleusine coracana subsp. coracana]|nr:hypothetical protein QOZ80_6BG0486290 [Eleusine coracana subsp. coracana]